MTMKKTILLSCLFLLAKFVSAQTIYISGNPSAPQCPGANITLCANEEAVTNPNKYIACVWTEQKSGKVVSKGSSCVNINPTVTTTYVATGYSQTWRSNTVTVNIINKPSQPQIPEGLTAVCVGGVTSYKTTSLNANNYTWKVNPSTAGIISGNSNSVSIEWNQIYDGQARVSVTGANICGISSPSDSLTVTVIKNVINANPGLIVYGDNSIQLRANPVASHYLWSTGDTTQSIKVNKSKSYTVSTTYAGNEHCVTSIGVQIEDNFKDSISVPNGEVYSIHRTGNVTYYGGDFNYVGAVSGNSILLNANSNSFDHQMPRVNGTVYCVISDGVGGWYLGGNFTQVGSYTRLNIAHINPDKTVDQSFNPTANDIVETMYLAGNTLFVGGKFTHIGDVNRNYIVALNKTTGMGTSWDAAANGRVRSIASYSDKLYVGGDFTSIGGNSRNYLACVDTVYAQSTSWNPNPNGIVNKIVVSGIKLYAAGDFSSIGGQSRQKLASYTLTLGLVDAWNPTPNARVYDLVVNNNTVYVAGAFTNIGTQNRNYIAALSSTSNTGLAMSWNPLANDTVFALALQGFNLIAGGRFTTIGGRSFNRIASLNLTNGTANLWNPNINGFKTYTPMVRCLATNGNSIYAGGQFYSAGGQTRNNVAAIDATSGSLLPWDANTNGIVRSVYALGNFVYLGGDFTQLAGYIVKNRIVQLRASDAVPTGWNPNANGNVHAITAKGNNLYVGGEFTTIGGNNRPKLAIVNIADGTSAVWAPNPNGTVRTLTIGGDTLYAGGDFTTIGGQTRNSAASYNITSQAITNFNPNANNSVYSIAVKGKKAFIGGSFTSLNSLSRNNLGVYDVISNSVTSDAFNLSNLNTVYSISGVDSAVYVGGKYTNTALPSNVVTNNSNAIKTSTLAMSDYWHPMPDDIVRSIFVYKDKVYLGGKFQHIAGTYQPYFAEVDNYFTGSSTIIAPTITKFCEGESDTIKAVKRIGYKYQWYKDNVIVNGAKSSFIVPTRTGNYTCAVTDTINYGTLFSNVVHVDVDPLADTTLTPSGATTFCGIGNVTLSAVTVASYAYQWYKDYNPIIGANSNSYKATTSGAYYCDVYNASGCARSTQIITVNSSGIIPLIINNTGVSTVCSGQTVSLSSSNTTGNLWYKDGASLGVTTQNLSINQSGMYKVYATNNGCSGYSKELAITITPLPATPIVTQNGNALRSSYVTGNQWHSQSGKIVGETNQDYTPLASGNYYTLVTVAGCNSNSSNIINVVVTGFENESFVQSGSIYPNPVKNELTIFLQDKSAKKITVEISNQLGQPVLIQSIDKSVNGLAHLDVSLLSSGIYYLQIKADTFSSSHKFVKQE